MPPPLVPIISKLDAVLHKYGTISARISLESRFSVRSYYMSNEKIAIWEEHAKSRPEILEHTEMFNAAVASFITDQGRLKSEPIGGANAKGKEFKDLLKSNLN